MPEIDIDVRLGGITPVTVLPTSTDVTILPGAGRLVGWSLRDVNATVPKAASGSVTGPAASAVIVTLTGLAAATYDVEWTVGLNGAATAADADNLRLSSSSGDILTSVNPGAQGSYPQPDAQVTVAANGSIDVYAIGAGTAGIVYSADITLSATAEVNTICEFLNGPNVIGECAFFNDRTDTRSISGDGVIASQSIVLHVVSGTVTGAVYVIPTY